jgi:hypothetical protein
MPLLLIKCPHIARLVCTGIELEISELGDGYRTYRCRLPAGPAGCESVGSPILLGVH